MRKQLVREAGDVDQFVAVLDEAVENEFAHILLHSLALLGGGEVSAPLLAC